MVKANIVKWIITGSIQFICLFQRTIVIHFRSAVHKIPLAEHILLVLLILSYMSYDLYAQEYSTVIEQTKSKTYYVDSTLGLDTNEGNSSFSAWKSLSKVNMSSFSAGDSILFVYGGIWSEQLLINCQGSKESPIYYGAYGDRINPNPTINGGGMTDAPILINSSGFLVIKGFKVTNFDGADVHDGAEAQRYGIRIGNNMVDQIQISILENEVCFIEGFSNHPKVGSPRGTILDPAENNQYGNGAICVNSRYINGLTIQGNYIHDCTCTGILVSVSANSNNVIIKSNSVYNVGSDGIEIWHSQSPVIELNAVIKAGNNSGSATRSPDVLGFNGSAVCGLWSFYCDSPLFQFNYCEGTKRIKWDGQAWDFDLGVTGKGIYQFNYSRDNEGGFNLGGLSKEDSGLVFRYNISYNDGSKQGEGQGFFNGSSNYYNNIFYRTDSKVFHFDNYTQCKGTFKNNIFYSNVISPINYQDQGRSFSNNCFFGHTAISPGFRALFTDPLLVDPIGAMKVPAGYILTLADFRNLVNGFKLKAGSPCIGAGERIPNNSAFDFWGKTSDNETVNVGASQAY